MRKIMLISALCSFLLFMLAGYYVALWIGERDKQMTAAEEEESKHVLQAKNMISEDTKIVYQYFYTSDRVTKEQVEPAPDYLLGLDMDQLKSVYNGWQLVLFSPETVILRCSIDGLSSESYILGEKDGFLAIFYEDAQKGIHLKEQTELPLSALPEWEATQIREGLRVTGEENLTKMLADFTS